MRRRTYPVKDLSPSLQRDALEDGQHGVEEIVEVGDPVVGSVPVLPALRSLGTLVGSSTWNGVFHHLIRVVVEAGFMEDAREELQADNGIDKNDKNDEECNVKERNHCHNYTIKNNL